MSTSTGSVQRDAARIELVGTCAEMVDNGLAPLVAAGLIKEALAGIVVADLRVAVLESCGAGTAVHMRFPRTLAAREAVSPGTQQIGGA